MNHTRECLSEGIQQNCPICSPINNRSKIAMLTLEARHYMNTHKGEFHLLAAIEEVEAILARTSQAVTQ